MPKYIKTGFLRVCTKFEEKVYGKLTAIGPAFMLPKAGEHRSYQVCQCECGSFTIIRLEGLRNGAIKSCGCGQREGVAAANTLHGCSNRKARLLAAEYNTWANMKARCLRSTHPQYDKYGGRGIKVCDRWLEPDGRGFMNFLEDMGPKPSTKHSIDRIDVNGHYEPSNCRWATDKEQANNKTKSQLFYVNGYWKTLSEWCTYLNLPYNTVRSRVKKLGWTVEDALTTPIGKRRNQYT
jgi:hypothetical protein